MFLSFLCNKSFTPSPELCEMCSGPSPPWYWQEERRWDHWHTAVSWSQQQQQHLTSQQQVSSLAVGSSWVLGMSERMNNDKTTISFSISIFLYLSLCVWLFKEVLVWTLDTWVCVGVIEFLSFSTRVKIMIEPRVWKLSIKYYLTRAESIPWMTPPLSSVDGIASLKT